MLNNFRKTFFSFALTVSMVGGLFYPILSANAQMAVPTNESGGIGKKECGFTFLGICTPMSLNAIGTMAAKTLIKTMTQDIVRWINDGFKGNPAFVSDPAGFFADASGEIIGTFIESSPDLNFLCSPFQIDIRLALAFKYSPFKRRISCTLKAVIKNSTNAVKNASINGQAMRGFLNGDFSKNGGWNSFVTMTQSPQNNIYGSYIQANTELYYRLGKKTELKRDELGQGKGFLSWNKCTKVPTSSAPPSGMSQEDLAAMPEYDSSTNSMTSTEEKCEVQTPGSVISSSLETSLGSGVRQLELADAFDEVINALVAQLMQKAITSGVRALSGSGPGDKSSYFSGEGANIEKLQNDAQLADNKSTTLGQIGGLINVESSYNDNYKYALSTAMTTLDSLNAVERCYVDKINSGLLSSSEVNIANQQITRADNVIKSEVSPELPSLNKKTTASDSNLKELAAIKLKIESATVISDISSALIDLDILNSTLLHKAQDVTVSQTERARIEQKMVPVRAKASQMLIECQQFPHYIPSGL
ncbi:MAG: hypothetical protein WCP15_00405 [bacterium]